MIIWAVTNDKIHQLIPAHSSEIMIFTYEGNIDKKIRPEIINKILKTINMII
ncbi:Uncharacterised protein [Chlamydia abortus]|nr:Uncharacterised protein [Chlamydia abortus]